jgi:tetratricopeptide (TPR) repeat protein
MAARHLAVLEAGGTESLAAYLDERYDIELDNGRADEAWALVKRAAERPDADLAVLDWCATRATSPNHEEYAFARDIWESMAERRPDLALPHIGLTIAYYKLSLTAGTDAERLERIERSVEAGRHASQLDPLYYQTYWNTFLALHRTRIIERGDEASMTTGDWEELLELATQSLRYNGLQPETLNAAAYVHVRLYEADGLALHLTQGMQLIRRAIRLTERVRGKCELPDSDRKDLSDYYDTLRDLQERAGDQPGALATARKALDVLGAGDPDVEKRTEQVTRLEGLGTDGK